MKFVQLILRKITKIVATRCQILRVNAPNSILVGAPPQTPLGSLQRSLRPLAGFKGPSSMGRKGRGGEGKRRRLLRPDAIATNGVVPLFYCLHCGVYTVATKLRLVF